MIRRKPWFVHQRAQRAARAGSLHTAMMLDQLLERLMHVRAAIAHHSMVLDLITQAHEALPGEVQPAAAPPERVIAAPPSWRTH